MKFSYNWLNSFFEKDLPDPEKLSEDLIMHFFEVEEVEKKNDDYVIDIDILPNRAYDCLSHEGVAREISAILELDFSEPETEKNIKKEDKDNNFEIEIDRKCASRYLLAGIKGVEIGKTPKPIKERLEACGLQSVNAVVDITNYVMLETGQPLHAFDGDKIEGNQIWVRRAKKDESITVLGGKRYKLSNSVPVIADKKGPVGIAGIKGGKRAEIDKKTNFVLLEAANFDPVKIRKASSEIKLRTDASLRFEHGMDPNLAEKAIKRTVHLIEKYCKGTLTGDPLDFYPKKKKKKKIKLSIENSNNLLGVKLNEKDITNILNRLNLKTEIKNKKEIEVTVPTYRGDLEIEEDLIEEVGRIYGYENITPQNPKAIISTPEYDKFLYLQEKVRDLFVGLGFTETYNRSFIDEKVKEIFNCQEELMKMKSPVSKKYTYLRPRLIPGILENIKDNQKKFDKIKIFEIGKTFNGEGEEEMIFAGADLSNFRKMKGNLDLLFQKIGLKNISYKAFESSIYDLQAAEIMQKNQRIGVLGKIKKDILKKMKVEGDPVVFEIYIEKLMGKSLLRPDYKTVSKFPIAVKDISVLVPEKTNYEVVSKKIRSVAGSLLIKIELFDLYQGDKIPEGKKNFGLRLSFRSDRKTLSKEDIKKLLDKIILTLQKEGEWEVRKK